MDDLLTRLLFRRRVPWPKRTPFRRLKLPADRIASRVPAENRNEPTVIPLISRWFRSQPAALSQS